MCTLPADTPGPIPAAGCTQTTHCTGPGYDHIDPRCRVYADDPLHRSRIRQYLSPLPGVRRRHTAPVPDTMTSIPAAGYTRKTRSRIAPPGTLPQEAGIGNCEEYHTNPDQGTASGRWGTADRHAVNLCFQKSGLFPPAPQLAIFVKRPHGPGYPPCFFGPCSHHRGEPMSRQGGAYGKIPPHPPTSGSGPATGRYGCVTRGGKGR